MKINEVLERARAALERGDPLAALDVAAEEQGAEDAELAYVRALALARLGDWRNALAHYESQGLDQRSDVDCLALKARLLKDRAFDSEPSDSEAILRQARDAYRIAYERTGDDFAAINTASLSAMLGDRMQAEDLARALLDRSSDSPRHYWDAATRAEALAIMQQLDDARSALERAAAMPDATAAARGTTYQQLRRLLLSDSRLDAATVAETIRPIRARRVAHFCGHMFHAAYSIEANLAAAVAQILRDEEIGMVMGALASGGDILIAEQALALGAELHIVFPFDRDDFIAQSVGAEWIDRFEACERAATGIHYASRMRFVFDDAQFAFGSKTAMGMAKLRAAQIHADTVQVAICDDVTAAGPAGAAADIATWQASGGRTRRLRTMGVQRLSRSVTKKGPTQGRVPRALRVLVFADFQGFSRLHEDQIPAFWQSIMTNCAKALAPYANEILVMNTWGDGLHFVLRGVNGAANVLTSLRDTLAGLDLSELGISGLSGMRIAGHFGSVYEMIDPVTGRPNFYGTEVSRAARLEAVTLPGQVYMTEPMAAALEMSCNDQFRARYVGRLTLPKNFGTERIYALEKRPSL